LDKEEKTKAELVAPDYPQWQIGFFYSVSGESHVSMKLYTRAKLTACTGTTEARRETIAYVS